MADMEVDEPAAAAAAVADGITVTEKQFELPWVSAVVSGACYTGGRREAAFWPSRRRSALKNTMNTTRTSFSLNAISLLDSSRLRSTAPPRSKRSLGTRRPSPGYRSLQTRATCPILSSR